MNDALITCCTRFCRPDCQVLFSCRLKKWLKLIKVVRYDLIRTRNCFLILQNVSFIVLKFFIYDGIFYYVYICNSNFIHNCIGKLVIYFLNRCQCSCLWLRAHVTTQWKLIDDDHVVRVWRYGVACPEIDSVSRL